ncbi:MAG: hypothetical protein IPI77_24005 [Saprospiraceae bacterium]|nr:hypothetical protein [Saprospiraceae bacterium]
MVYKHDRSSKFISADDKSIDECRRYGAKLYISCCRVSHDNTLRGQLLDCVIVTVYAHVHQLIGRQLSFVQVLRVWIIFHCAR